MATFTLLGFGAMNPVLQAAEDIARPDPESHLMLAATEGMDRRQDRRDDRRDDRGDRRDVRQDCRQEGREERRDDNDD